MIRICFTSLLFMFVQLSLANSFHDDSHYVPLGARTGYYVVRDGSRLSHQLGVDDSRLTSIRAIRFVTVMARTCSRFDLIMQVN